MLIRTIIVRHALGKRVAGQPNGAWDFYLLSVPLSFLIILNDPWF